MSALQVQLKLKEQAYDDEHKSFSEEIFDKLVTSIGGRRVGNEVTVSDEESGKITRCVLFPLDAEILVSVSTNVSHDIGAMYASFIIAKMKITEILSYIVCSILPWLISMIYVKKLLVLNKEEQK